MPAYFIIDLTVRDLSNQSSYEKLVTAVVERFGGRFLVRGGASETIEGDWYPDRIVVLEFPDIAAIKNMYGDPEYVRLKKMRLAGSSSKAIAVEGLRSS